MIAFPEAAIRLAEAPAGSSVVTIAREVLAGLLALGLAACSTGASTAPSVEPTAEPSTQPSASTAPSPALTPTTSVLNVKVTFDGETCTYLGPSVIVDGTVMRFEYAPDQSVATSSLLIYGVKPGATYEDLLESLVDDDGDVTTDIFIDIPDWVYEPTAAWVQGTGTMLYTIESVKQGQDAVDYAVGGYQVMCNTPAGYPAVQLSVAGP